MNISKTTQYDFRIVFSRQKKRPLLENSELEEFEIIPIKKFMGLKIDFKFEIFGSKSQ